MLDPRSLGCSEGNFHYCTGSIYLSLCSWRALGRLGNVNPILGVLCPNTVARKFRYVLLPRIINYAKTELNWDPPAPPRRISPLLPPSFFAQLVVLETWEMNVFRFRESSFLFFFLREGERSLRGRVLNWGNEGFEGCSKRGKHGRTGRRPPPEGR